MPVDRVLLGACRGFREGPGFRLAAASEAYERRIGTHVFGLCFTPDGSRIMVGVARTVRMYDAHSGAELACVPMPDDVRAVAPDGSSVCEERHVYVSRAPNGETRGVLHDEHDHSLRLAFSGDSRVIVGLQVSGRPGRLRAWNTEGVLIAELARVGGVGAFAVSADGKTVVLADDDFPGLTLSAFAIGDAPKRAPIRLPREGGIRMVALSGDAMRAVVAGQEGLRIVDLVSGESTQPFAARRSQLISGWIACSPDLSVIARAAPEGLGIWRDGVQVTEVGFEIGDYWPGVAIAVSPDARTVALAGKDGTVHLVDVATGQERLPPARAETVRSMVVSKDGRAVSLAPREPAVRLDVTTLDRIDGNESAFPHEASYGPVAWKEKEELVFATEDSLVWRGEATASHPLRIGSYATSDRHWEIQRPAPMPEQVLAVAVDPPRALTCLRATGYRDDDDMLDELDRLWLWDVRVGTQEELAHVEDHPIQAAAFSPDGLIVWTSSDGPIHILDAVSRKELQLVPFPAAQISRQTHARSGSGGVHYRSMSRAIAIARGRRVWAVAWGQIVLLYLLGSPEPAGVIDLASAIDRASSLCFTPDGGSLLVGTARGAVLRFELTL